MAEKFNPDPPLPKKPASLEQEEAAQERARHALEKQEKRTAFAAKFLTRSGFPPPVRERLEQLTEPELAFMRGYIDAHAGEWDLYDMKGVLVTGVQVENETITVTFCIVAKEKKDDVFLERSIPRTVQKEAVMIAAGSIKPRSSTPRC